MESEQIYRFGAIDFTLADIRRTGFNHGAADILYYPPQCERDGYHARHG